jgi:hypothetical protein
MRSAPPANTSARVADVSPAVLEEECLHPRGVWHRDEKGAETVAIVFPSPRPSPGGRGST